MQAKKPCRHKDAWPTIYNSSLGYFWCPDCGAIRQARTLAPACVTFADDHWIYPRGKEDVLKQLDRVERI